VFKHDHLSVTWSRVRDSSKVTIVTKNDSLITIGTEQTLQELSNIVYPDLLSDVHIFTDSEYDSYELLDSLMRISHQIMSKCKMKPFLKLN